MRPTTPLLLAPLSLEARAVARGAPSASITKIGMGPVRATAARARIVASEPEGRPIALLGVAGGLVAGMEPGDVVVGTKIVSLDSGDAVELAHAPEVAALLEAAGLSVRRAPIVSSPKIVTGADERRAAAATGAIAVDMESYWCAPLAGRHPFVVVRVLLDLPERELFSPRLPGALRRTWRALHRSARTVSSWSPTTLNTENLLEVGES